MLQAVNQTVMKLFIKKTKHQNFNDLKLQNIPEGTYNYTEYRDGLISDDFK